MREAWEASLGENHRLREELRQRDQEIADLRARADEVRETLVLARRMTLDIEANARREADLILGEARLEAERIVASVHEEKLRLEQALVRLKTTRVHHVAQMRATLAATGRMLDEIERD